MNRLNTYKGANMAKKNQHRQGDVGIFPTKIPTNAAPKKVEGRIVLAYGEVTGHAHAISEVEAQDVEVYEKNGKTYLRVKEPVTVKHEEHTAQPLTPGDYEVRIQREYHPEAIRNVAD